MSRITHGVDGLGIKHYLCDHCELVFGDVDPTKIKHDCDKSKPKGHNRDKAASCWEGGSEENCKCPDCVRSIVDMNDWS